jgi:predicted DNA-binding transcriptional regulator AlpA
MGSKAPTTCDQPPSSGGVSSPAPPPRRGCATLRNLEVQPREKILCTMWEAEQLVSMSAKTINRLIDANEFPKPVNTGRDMILFRVSDLIHWAEKLGN